MAWKIYSVVFAAIALAAPTALLSTDPTVFDYIDLLASVTVVVGLIGFAFRKAIATEAFWRAAFIVLVVWDVAYGLLIARILNLGLRGVEDSVIVWIRGLAFVAAYVGVFRSALRRHDLWQRTEEGR